MRARPLPSLAFMTQISKSPVRLLANAILQENATNRSVPQSVQRKRAKPCASNEALKLAPHEQGGATLVLTSIELPEEGPQALAHDAVLHPYSGARRTQDREASVPSCTGDGSH